MRGKRYESSSLDRQKIYYIIGIVALICLVALIFTLSIYKSKQEANSEIAKMENITSSDATIVSTTEDKSINEVTNETSNNITNESLSENTSETEKIAINTEELMNTQIENNVTPEPTEIVEEPKVVELHFMVPVEGEILKDFADSNLVYSETLQEWTVHLGIDIKAERGSAVVASETGTVESIKNDPRYGTTVTITHENGYKTIYSNLLSADFVQEGQTVEKGQTIGSVGDNAAFEIADEPHLHFEMKKDGETVNPSNYWEK